MENNEKKNINFYYGDSHTFAAIDGKLYECDVKTFVWNNKQEKGEYTLSIGGKDVTISHDAVSFYSSKNDFKLGYKRGSIYSFVDLVRQNVPLDAGTLLCCVLWRVVDKRLVEVKIDDIEVVRLEYAEGLPVAYFDDIPAREFYSNRDDAIAFNEVEVVNRDGTTETVGGELKVLIFDEQQKAAIDMFEKAVAALKDAKVGTLYYDGSLRFINTKNADFLYEDDCGLDEYRTTRRITCDYMDIMPWSKFCADIAMFDGEDIYACVGLKEPRKKN